MDMGCLFFQPSAMKWLDALVYCRDRNANLVMVETELQMQYLRVELKVWNFNKALKSCGRMIFRHLRGCILANTSGGLEQRISTVLEHGSGWILVANLL